MQPVYSSYTAERKRSLSMDAEHGFSDSAAMEIGAIIRAERQARGWSLRDLAKMLRCSHGLIAQWENGDLLPTVPRLIDLCTVFGISADRLLEKAHGEIVVCAAEREALHAWRAIHPDDRAVALRQLRNTARRPIGIVHD